jgi:hypothetical protein
LLTSRGSKDDAPGAGDAASSAMANGALASEPGGRSCAKCGQPLQEGQDWCLHCGTGAPGSLGRGPGWRTAAAILVSTLVLIAAASVAAYAALEKKEAKPTTVAKTPTVGAPASATPGAPTTSTPGATTTPIPSIPTTSKATPPKIPLQTPTPKSSGSAAAEANEALFPPEGTKAAGKTKASTPAKEENSPPSNEGNGSSSEGGSEGKSEPASPILLDTNAASTYNPYAYPPALFGDPSLAIDGEAKTAWTAQVQATSAPKMAEGLLIDLKSPQKLSSAKVKTSTTGITVEIYGANGHTLPGSITDPTWKRLVGLKVLSKKGTSFRLKTEGKGYRYVVLWLAQAQPSSSAANPGSVSINEFELFPPS